MDVLRLPGSNTSKYFLYLFLLYVLLLCAKFMKHIAGNFELFLSGTFYLETLLVIACFAMLYFIGDGIRKLLRLSTVSAGIVSFFAVTFFINVAFGIFNISSVIFEICVLMLIGGIALIHNIFTLKQMKKRLIFGGLLVFILGVLRFLPQGAFVVKAHTLGDVNWFWYPVSLQYFREGFLNAFVNSNIKGYGLFVHHVWVVIKRFVAMNPYSLDAFHFMPKVLFFMGVLFIQELNVSKVVKMFASLVFISFTIPHTWIAQLLFNSLMGEGVTALCFAVMLNEVLVSRKNGEVSRGFLFSWLAMGMLFITKPFISYLVLLTPFILVSNFFAKDSDVLPMLRKFVIALVLSFSGYLMWHILNGSHGFSSNAYAVGAPTQFGFASDILAIKFCLKDRAAALLFLIGLCSVFLGMGISKLRNIFITVPAFFVILNFSLVLGLYATFWLGYSDIESAYRYFMQIFYVAFIAFLISLQIIWEDSKNH